MHGKAVCTVLPTTTNPTTITHIDDTPHFFRTRDIIILILVTMFFDPPFICLSFAIYGLHRGGRTLCIMVSCFLLGIAWANTYLGPKCSTPVACTDDHVWTPLFLSIRRMWLGTRIRVSREVVDEAA